MISRLPQKIFISRELKSDSVFYRLAEQGHQIIGQSLIDIEYLDFDVPAPHDAVFFYSQKAIKHFFSKQPYDDNKSYGVMGRGSAAFFLSITNVKADIIGDGNKESIAKTINKQWYGYTVLFPIAQESLRSIHTLLDNITTNDLVVYTNTVKKKFEIPACDILLFTSPLNVKAYLSQYALMDQKVYAIGQTTARSLKKFTGKEVEFCEKPSIVNLYKLVLPQLLSSGI